MADTEDPFPQVQQEVRSAWASLTSSNASLSNIERAQRLTALSQDVADLHAAVAIARTDPARFRLTARQLSSRAQFVADMQRAIRALLDRHSLAPMGGGFAGAGGGAREAELEANDAFVDGEVSTQATLLADQDRDLDELASAVQRIGNLGRDMHTELEQQGDLLEDLGGRFDGTIASLRKVRQRVEDVMQQTGRRNFCTVVWLSVVFLGLTLLVVLT